MPTVTVTSAGESASVDYTSGFPPLPAGWTRTLFADDFTGIALDSGKWNVHDGTTQNNMSANNWARNVTLRNGQLVITGRREQTTTTDGSNRTCQYSTGYVDTINKLAVPFGSRVEIRAQLPTPVGPVCTGIWPAGWARSNGGLGEIDLFEAWGQPTSGTAAALNPPDVYRSGSFSSSVYANTNLQAAGKVSGWGTPAGAAPIASAFHTFAVEWDATSIRCYLDGNPPHVTAPATLAWYQSSFPQAAGLNLRINLQIGSAYWGQPTAQTVMPVEFLVDWVRVLGR